MVAVDLLLQVFVLYLQVSLGAADIMVVSHALYLSKVILF
jgi:hypothetical protein